MKTSVYLNQQRTTALRETGLPLLDIIDLGLEAARKAAKALETGQKADPGGEIQTWCPCLHPIARRAKGLCMACGRTVA